MKKIIRKNTDLLLSLLGYKLIKEKTFQELLSNKEDAEELKFILKYPANNSIEYFKIRDLSKSQLKQDLFVLSELKFKKEGYFVEFGVCDGLLHSNTYLLEKQFNWNGIVAEPGKCWHNDIEKNRNVSYDKNCVWSETGKEVKFNEVNISSLSTIQGFGENDNHSKLRNSGKIYSVQTISLNDLLKKYNAPNKIDYLSIDTEGSEFVILENVDFKKFEFKIITVEHNYTPIREKIYNLLLSNGYKRVMEEFSKFDDWYVLDA